MNNMPQVVDLTVFTLVVKNKSFVKAADELGASPAYVSKRIQVLEQTLNCKLLHRSTRSLSLTEDGEVVYDWASNILLDLKDMTETVASHPNNPIGTLSITSSLGFGRRHVAPLLSDFVTLYPKLKIRFDAVDKVQDLIAHHIDLDIRIGNDIAPHLIAKKLHPNKRILCAAPAYLADHGTPKTLKDLLQHECLVIKERDHPFGLWELNSTKGGQDIKVSGTLASNNGEMVRLWALAGHGIMLRSVWDVGAEIERGTLVQVLPDYWQDADIWAVYPSRLNASAKLRVCVEFFEQQLAARLLKVGAA
ncbi:MAG: LysR family transcriptional regulator [Neisseriaceae bacterium]|nr:LysR family transcriptional regulator [Neisseriaceae bacterium]